MAKTRKNPLRTLYGLTNARCLKVSMLCMLITFIVENLLIQDLHWKIEHNGEVRQFVYDKTRLNIKRMSWLPRLLTVNLKASK